MEFLFEYGLFLAKALTLVASLIVGVAVIIGLGTRSRSAHKGHIEVSNLKDALQDTKHALQRVILDPEMLKVEIKKLKKRDKATQKQCKEAIKSAATERKARVFVVDFDGDVQASKVDNLRQEVTAILSVAEPLDEVVIRLESPGGLVHGYGLAASQLSRIVSKQISLTVTVDKVAASGGYMMACIADRIISAPFALLGSIGVVAQIPNFHRLLKGKEIDVEVLTAGEYKRTLTMFGKNTTKGRKKFIEELENVHTLFKEFVSENRKVVNIDAVATGEAWYGKRALEKNLIDEIKTSDEYIVEKCATNDVFHIKFVEEYSRIDKILERLTNLLLGISGRDDFNYQGPFKF